MSEIMVFDGKFAIGMMPEFNFKWNTDNSLSVWAKGKAIYPFADVSTYSGTFIEAVDTSGTVIASGGDGQRFEIPITKAPIVVRIKALPKITLIKAELEKRRQVVTRYLVSDAPYSLKIPDKLAGVIKWLEKQAKAIPEASRAKARFRFDTTMEHGETYPNIEITYEEPETDKELITRLQIEAERARIAEEEQRSQFEALKTKFAPARMGGK